MYYIGIDLGGTNIAVGIVDGEGRMIKKDSIPTKRERTFEEIVKDMAIVTRRLIENSEIDPIQIKHIGIGSPGVLNSEEGIVIYSCNFNFDNVPLRKELQKYIDLPIYIDNDANCAALAESIAGAAKGAEHSVAVTIGTGIGGGVVINKKIYSGFNYAAAELGHTVIVSKGEPCACGRQGCWEAYASASALIRQTKRAAKENPNSLINTLVDGDISKIDAKIPFIACRQGDPVAKEVVQDFIWYLAEGMINVINTFQPEILVIGGGVCREGDYLLDPVKELVKKGVYSRNGMPETKIQIAQMGNDAGIIGAAMLGL